MKRKVYAILFLCLTITGYTIAQEITVHGIVSDQEGNPLPGVTILIKGTSHGTFTDKNGEYHISKLQKDDILVFSYIGYIPQEIVINGSSNEIKIMLEEDVRELSEVVVIGYGVQKKSCVTGSISSLSGSEISDYGSTRTIEALRGYTPGIVTSVSRKSDKVASKEGDDIRIRGISSITETGTDVYVSNSASARLLTAGEINDFSKWVLWSDISKGELNNYSNVWGINTDQRYSVQVETEHGYPVIGAKIQLVNQEDIIWNAITDNTGKAELWANPFGQKVIKDSDLNIFIEYNGNKIRHKNVKSFQKGVNIITLQNECVPANTIDIAFVVDATGSMMDEINYLKAEMENIMTLLNNTLPENTINLGCEFYRDHGDEYLTKISNLSTDHQNAIDFIRENTANGGGDGPEAVEIALDTVISAFNWSENAVAKVIFLILDAPPHQEIQVINKLKNVIQKASEKGIRIVPVTCSGIDKSTEYLMRTIALLTNGTYVFLTDDSGIGGSHIKPSTDKYTVELLNDVIVRLIVQYSSYTSCTMPVILADSDTLIVKSAEPILYSDKTDSLVSDNIHPLEDTLSGSLENIIVEWKCFPNPSTGIVNIQSDKRLNDFFICDISGKIIIRHNVSEENQTIVDLTAYPIGTYFVRYEYEPNKWMSGKILLVR